MARAKVILVDADVIAHFIATGHIMELNGILSPHQLYVVENVYREATRHPGDANRKQKVDEWIKDSKTCVIKFPSQNQNIKREFFKLNMTMVFWVMVSVPVWRWLAMDRKR